MATPTSSPSLLHKKCNVLGLIEKVLAVIECSLVIHIFSASGPRNTLYCYDRSDILAY